MPMPQRVAITGSSGLIGSALSAFLRERGDEVVHLVRRPSRTPDEITWDPTSRQLDPASLDGVTAVVNLAGAGVGDQRWTPKYQQQILASRVDSTHTIATALAQRGGEARLVSGSAVGFYGDRDDEVLTEDSSAGSGFLTEVVRAWEAATAPAAAAGIPVAFSRTGLVMAPHGGALERMIPLAKAGINGPLGSGRQWWPWISLRDTVAALTHLVDHPEVVGPVNVVGASPARQRDVAKALGRAVHRPAVLPAPSFGIKAVLGGFAVEVLTSKRAVPARLTDSGFVHQDVDLDATFAALIS
jgi:uncharacterized protein (TIGR01777 family)